MNKDQLETLLRAKVETVSSRPGFETRIQALSREPFEAKKKRRSWIAIPALAAITLGLIISRPADEPASTVVKVVEPIAPEKDESLSFIENTPVHRELQAVKSDAEKTMSFLARSLPSLSLTKKK